MAVTTAINGDGVLFPHIQNTQYPTPNAEVTKYAIQILIYAALSRDNANIDLRRFVSGQREFTHFSGVISTSLNIRWCSKNIARIANAVQCHN